jgi:hypothetical protein
MPTAAAAPAGAASARAAPQVRRAGARARHPARRALRQTLRHAAAWAPAPVTGARRREGGAVAFCYRRPALRWVGGETWRVVALGLERGRGLAGSGRQRPARPVRRSRAQPTRHALPLKEARARPPRERQTGRRGRAKGGCHRSVLRHWCAQDRRATQQAAAPAGISHRSDATENSGGGRLRRTWREGREDWRRRHRRPGRWRRPPSQRSR